MDINIWLLKLIELFLEGVPVYHRFSYLSSFFFFLEGEGIPGEGK